MKIAAVLDSTCLIGLERIGRLDLLTALLDPVLAPPTVIAEFGFQPAWLTAAAPTNTGTVAALNLTVDVGEAEAIALAHERVFDLPERERYSAFAAQNCW
ncbi:MAG TPA: hypothetical protein VIS96_01115 [Terrimicrobiaceae bacterium]